ncbi:MAG: hypothetical protein HY270_03495 [Deltaproteobacteria bacterium]|nr:hypothetical protein [Deltaproteobacteria bacterium]
MAHASSHAVRFQVVPGGRKGPPAWLLPRACDFLEHDVYTARSMKLLLRSPQAAVLRAAGQAIGAAVGVTSSELLIVAATWLGRAHWRRIPLRLLRGAELYRGRSANRLHIAFDGKEMVLMYWPKAARDFDRVFAALRRLTPGTPPPRMVVHSLLSSGRRQACGG